MRALSLDLRELRMVLSRGSGLYGLVAYYVDDGVNHVRAYALSMN